METLAGFFESHGYWVLLGVGFAEYAGVPIASVPVLVAAGALAAGGEASLLLITLCAAGGGLLADALWYGLARWHGPRLLGVACGLTSNRSACVLGVEGRLRTLGAPYLLGAKFVPGAGNLVGPAAGLGGMPAVPFLAVDAAALLLWAGAYASLGALFHAQVAAVLVVGTAYARWVLGVALLLVVGAAAWRVVRARRHGHGPEPVVEGPVAVDRGVA